MQFTFRVDDSNYLTFDIQLQRSGDQSSTYGPELVAAVVSDSKLSNLQDADLLGIAEQIVDYCSRDQSSTQPGADWFQDEWLPATKVNGS